ncbi:Pesticidal crystal protein cry3Ba [Fusarium austroafricanum]|uniref:Pesticidal crystal protein cry3Ba n=1 Tax=Fusarium austroafricanum TaxID=2364996 RepID=A0A8H4K597_9HYPO|nr:Pesticidal crystal protein cry3Ba [Fusarium austroafricanum]
MGIKISEKFLNDLTTKLLKAADGGQKLGVTDPDEVGQYVCSVLALGCELIPVIGSSLSALTTLVGGLLFHPNSIEKIWEKLRERIEALIDSKISETQMEILRKKIRGLQDNMENYQQIWEDFKDSSGEERIRARDTLKTTHIAFLSVVRAAIPEFRVERFAVPSLPLFALAANIHLMLLSDGIRHGIAWGYSEKNVNTMRAEFKKKTTPKGVLGQAADIVSEQNHLLKGAIATAIDLEMPTEIVDTWKDAYSDLSAPASGYAGGDSYDDLDYATYAYKVYHIGRGQVKPYRAELNDYDNRGSQAAATLRAYADYDSGMVMNVLNYAEYWPYLAGDKMPESVLKRLDREIYFGPFGRYTAHAAWTESSEPPITDRGPPITSAYVRGGDDIDGLQMRYGNSWGDAYGSTTGGRPKQLDLAKDEYFYWVSVWYGQKLGKLRFWNNKDKALENGNARHGSYGNHAAPPGYRLTSVHITRWERSTPPGCEGIILGFRPSAIEFTPN